MKIEVITSLTEMLELPSSLQVCVTDFMEGGLFTAPPSVNSPEKAHHE